MGNVEFGPKSRGVDKKARRERAEYFIKLVGLEGFEKSFPNQQMCIRDRKYLVPKQFADAIVKLYLN